ncbi:MAG: helix-turn-helix domain-containing protein [Chlamydiota bacterium]
MSAEIERKAFGEIFAKRRKEMNLSLKEVENAISIRLNYLQAIEEGHVGKLISPVHAQGFIKQYATFLGVDGDQVIKEGGRSLQMPHLKQEFSYGIGTLEARGSQSGGVKWLPNALWALAGLAILTCAWLVAKYFDLV